MHKLMILPAALLLFAPAAYGLSPGDNGAFTWRVVGQAGAPQLPRYTVRAGPVANADSRALSGTFQLLRTGSPTGIPSSGLVGACLIFRAADLGFERMAARQCRSDADCSTPGENLFGTCDVETKQCWAKPDGPAASAALCNRGFVAAASDLNPVPARPADVRPFGIARGAKVRVGACVNKSGINPVATGCLTTDGPDKITDLGPIATVR